VLDAPGYQGPKSDHFDGRRFRNLDDPVRDDFRAFLQWMATRRPGRFRRIEAEPGPPPPRRVEDGTLRVTFVNHATVLLQVDGLNVLTDPVYAERIGPVRWAGPKRFRPPGVRFEDLPPIDLVLVSHNHYDHLCVPTLRRLAATFAPRIVTGLGNVRLLLREGIAGGVELDWWDDVTVGDGARVIAVPARHFSQRGLRDRDNTLWCGLVLRTASGSVFFAGDTGYGRHFAMIRERLGAPRLALLPIGAYRPEWFMRRVHMSPDDAVRAHLDLGARTSVGIHWGTFRLADDGQDEPLRDLARALETHGVRSDRFVTLEHGIGHELAQTDVLSTAAE
jgi:L-ascorbate metabolism protein UlaG (beta-lactamase superfamily)